MARELSSYGLSKNRDMRKVGSVDYLRAGTKMSPRAPWLTTTHASSGLFWHMTGDTRQSAQRLRPLNVN